MRANCAVSPRAVVERRGAGSAKRLSTDFASPQSLVAFALALTLFVITLILNIVALQIVRRYREQYE